MALRSPAERAWVAVGYILIAGVVASGCGAIQSTPAAQTDIRLPPGEYASLALADDGAVWVTDSYGWILRVEPSGGFTEYPLPENEEPELDFPGDIVDGPDGAMWFTTTSTIGRIDPKGTITRSDLHYSFPTALTSVDDALWYVVSDSPPRIERMSAEGEVTARMRLTSLRDDPFELEGIASAPDGALWFTESSYEPEKAPDAIGRVTSEGQYASWPLPRRRSGPTRIAAGPDKALWFTEELGHRIGRITATGELTEYALQPEVNPTAIVAGKDDGLWFTSDTCLGRISTGGDITMWRVDRAKRLVDIEAAPDGSFWLLDAVGHALRQYTPPRPAVASKADCQPPSAVAQDGGTRAVLSYKPVDYDESSGDFFTDPRIRISRHGEEVFSEKVPSEASEYAVYGSSKSFAVRDLDGDGEPEVRLELTWNGTHCCEWSRIYRFEPSRGTYVAMTHMWADALASPTLRDVDDDGRPEFLSKDDRFTELVGYSSVFAPIQVWSYDQGKFSDVTRAYPKLIEGDAVRLWRFYLEHRAKGESVRYVLAAWAADQYMLDRQSTVDRVLAEALERGELRPRDFESEDAADFVPRLKAFLRKSGYIRG